MRVIKFRVWDCELKEMIYDAQDESGYESDGFTDFLHQESRYKVMQFTGLLDKSGKEIWEGDIVEGLTFKEPHALRTSVKVRMEVIFQNGQFLPAWSSRLPKGFRTIPWLGPDVEVLGNIYENPELMK